MILKNILLALLVIAKLVNQFCLANSPLSAQAITIIPEQLVLDTYENRIQVKVPLQYAIKTHDYFAGDLCGYFALYVGIILAQSLQIHQKNFSNLYNIDLLKRYFGNSRSEWISIVVNHRACTLAKNYIRDTILKNITFAQPIENAETSEFQEGAITFQLNLLPDRILFQTRNQQAIKNELEILVNVLTNVANALQNQGIRDEDGNLKYVLCKENIIQAFRNQLTQLLNNNNIENPVAYTALNTNEKLEEYLSAIDEISFKIKGDSEIYDVNSDNLLFRKNWRTFSKKTSAQSFPIGDWISSEEIELLIAHERTQGELLAECDTIEIVCFEGVGPNGQDIENLITWQESLSNLRGKLRDPQTSFLEVVIINSGAHWINCVISKNQQNINYIISDSLNISRINHPIIINFLSALEGHRIAVPIPKESHSNSNTNPSLQIPMMMQEITKEDSNLEPIEASKELLLPFVNKEDNKKDDYEYRAPLAAIKTEDLPTLQSIFGDQIPNRITILIRELKFNGLNSIATESKRCLVIDGPPGTGKSTAAQLIARKISDKVLFANGSNFRTAYQGSGPCAIKRLFDKAKKIGTPDKPAIIIIDEFDGMAQSLQDKAATPEDNRTIKAFIAALDQYLYDKSIFVICTTNYLEKIESSIKSRFISIKINVPHYQARKTMLLYYLKKNNIKSYCVKNESCVSSEFMKMLITATKGLSGRDIKDIVNNAARDFRHGLKPEHGIAYNFGWNIYDFYNRPIQSIILSPTIPFTALGIRFIAEHYKPLRTDMERHLYAQYHHVINSGSPQKKLSFLSKVTTPFLRISEILVYCLVSTAIQLHALHLLKK